MARAECHVAGSAGAGWTRSIRSATVQRKSFCSWSGYNCCLDSNVPPFLPELSRRGAKKKKKTGSTRIRRLFTSVEKLRRDRNWPTLMQFVSLSDQFDSTVFAMENFFFPPHNNNKKKVNFFMFFFLLI